MLLLLLLVFHVVSMVTAGTPFNHSIYRMAALKDYLLTDYDVQVRRYNLNFSYLYLLPLSFTLCAVFLFFYFPIKDPPTKDGRPVNVSLGFNFHKVKSISIDSGLMEVNAWLRMEWYGKYLESIG